MKNILLKLFVTCAFAFIGTKVNAQCPQITCPANITVNNDAGTCGAVVNYTAPIGTDPCASGSNTYNYTGSVQTFTVPTGVTSVTIQAFGAQGGSNAMGVTGGRGGEANGTLAVTPGDVLNIYVGGTNGYNGGGATGAQPCGTARGGVGGGASDVRLNGTGLGNRIIVAGGGGGAGGNRRSGCGRGSGGGGGGGYYGGGGGAAWPFGSTILPTGGTQVAGGTGGTSTYTGAGGCNNGTNGALGVGGNGGCEVSSNQGGSGTALAGGVGGGLSGGGGAYSVNWTGQSGAGGSSYITGLTGSSTNSGVRNGNGQVVISYAGATVSTTQTAGLGSGATFPVGTTTETYTATNIHGTVTCSFTVTVVDAEAPAISCPANITVNNDAGTCGAVVNYTAPVGTDNCAGPFTTQTAGLGSGATFPVGTTTETYMVSDSAGNTTSCSFTVTVVDAEAPAISCPANITVNNDAGTCGAVVNYTAPVGTDNCAGPFTTQTAGLGSGATFPVGTTTETYMVSDSAGNTTSCSFTVTVVDAEAPAISCPANITVNNDAGTCGAVVNYTAPVGTDNCAGPFTTQTAGLGSGATFPVGTTTETYMVSDSAGNTTSCSFTVTVVDAEAPAVSCQNITTYLDNSGNVIITANDIDGGSTDNCGIDTLIASQTTFTCNEIGANNVTLYVYDSIGNVDSCTAIVTVTDTTSPTAMCQNINAYLDANGTITITGNDIDGGSTDNCGIDTLIANPASFTCNELGANNVTLTVVDDNGNSSNCTAVVTVLDTLAPIVFCNDTSIYLDMSGNASITANDLDSNSTDNCGITSMVASMTAFTCNEVGANNITLTVTDNNGNVDSCTAVVTVIDSVAPVAQCQNINAYLDNSGSVIVLGNDIDGGSTDNCGIDTLIASPSSFTCNELGANNVTLLAYDTYGNVDSCTAVVTIMDTLTPTATCQNINAYLDANGSVSIAANDIDGGSIDNCSIDSIYSSPSLFTCNEIGANNVTLFVIDASGNIDSCTAIVTVSDTIAPGINCPSNQMADADNTCEYEIDDYTGLASVIMDNCDSNNVTVTQIPAPGSIVIADDIADNAGQTVVTIIVEDMSGNTDTCTFIVDVECGSDFSIPNVFTPNGDGTNDVWNISGIDAYPDIKVQVFNRWGDLMFESSNGYTEPWDGTYNGTEAPSATYYYIIDLGTEEEGISGTINIIR